MSAIAAAASAQGADIVVAGGKAALGSLYALIRERFGRNTPEAAVLDVAVGRPRDDNRIQELAAVLARVMDGDPAFAQEIVTRWRAMQVETSADHDAVINNFSGEAERSVQARDIHGGVTF